MNEPTQHDHVDHTADEDQRPRAATDSVLESDFEILDQRQESQLSIVNGRQAAVVRLLLTVEPRHDGDIQIPSFQFGNERTSSVLLRVDPATHEAAGLTILNFSVHAQAEHELPLPGLDEEPEVKSMLLQLLNAPPVDHFLGVVEGEHGARVTLRRPSLQEALVG